ncbi:MAG: cytochrome c maturation protein CcmE [Salinibacter sp.]
MKWKSILGLIAMAGFAGLLLLNFGNQVGGYMSFKEAAQTDAAAHVVGTWVEDRPTHYDRTENVFTFYMRDQSGTVRKVRYPSPKPANFEQAQKVVVEGTMNGKAFAADHILVKCPSKYNNAKGLKKQAGRSSSSSTPRAKARGN